MLFLSNGLWYHCWDLIPTIILVYSTLNLNLYFEGKIHCIWGPEGKLQELIYSFLHVGSGTQIRVIGLRWQSPLPFWGILPASLSKDSKYKVLQILRTVLKPTKEKLFLVWDSYWLAFYEADEGSLLIFPTLFPFMSLRRVCHFTV